jgi:predicted phosphodiesterase
VEDLQSALPRALLADHHRRIDIVLAEQQEEISVDLVESVSNDPCHLQGRPVADFHAFLDAVEEALRGSDAASLVRLPSDRPIQVIGDSHGDYASVERAVRYARAHDPPQRFVGLGDYIDRATRSEPEPTSLPGGSVWNLAFLLAWAARAPHEVILLRGNHEAPRRFPVPVMTFLKELRREVPRGEALAIYSRCLDLCDRLPAAASSENGVFLSHGGIPPPHRWDLGRSVPMDAAVLEGLLWSDPIEDYEDRGVGFAYTAQELEGFLRTNGWQVMIKGHAPVHLGRSMHGGRLLTIHTSDLFQRFGHQGILMAEIPAKRPVRSTRDLTVRRLVNGSWRPYTIEEGTRGSHAPDPLPEP